MGYDKKENRIRELSFVVILNGVDKYIWDTQVWPRILSSLATPPKVPRHHHYHVPPHLRGWKPGPDAWIPPKWIPGVVTKKQKTLFCLKPYNTQKDGFDPNYIGVDPLFVGEDNFRIAKAEFGPGALGKKLRGRYRWERVGSRVQGYWPESRWVPEGYDPFDSSIQALKRLGRNEIPELEYPQELRKATWVLAVQPHVIQSPCIVGQNLKSFAPLSYEKIKTKPRKGSYIEIHGKKERRWCALEHEKVICPAGFEIIVFCKT